MSRNYFRVIPRDLFNEANLLKCLGQLYIQTECYEHADVVYTDDEPFDIWQCPHSGNLHCGNVTLKIKGRSYDCYRPLTSRDPYPLWIDGPQDAIAIFCDDDSLTEEFKGFIND